MNSDRVAAERSVHAYDHSVIEDQTLKNRNLLVNYYLPGDLEEQIDEFVGQYNHRRCHESLKNLTPADASVGKPSY